MATLQQKVTIGMAMEALPDSWLSHLLALSGDPKNAAATTAWNALPKATTAVIDGYVKHLKSGNQLKKSDGGTIGPLSAEARAKL